MASRSSDDVARVALVVTSEQRDALQKHADACGMSFAAWAREVLLAAAAATPLREHAKAGRRAHRARARAHARKSATKDTTS